MILVHLSLDHSEKTPLPRCLSQLICACAIGDDGLEHVVVHPLAEPGPVVGLFLRSTDVASAEEAAVRLWFRAVKSHSWLSAWRLRAAEAPRFGP